MVCKSLIAEFENSGHWKFLGLLNPEQIAAFYPNLDILVLPSINSTESFGLVQIEAMINGIPVVASDLPGVRQPVKIHQFGKIFPVGDSNALASALIDLLEHPIKGKIDSQKIKQQYSPVFTDKFLKDILLFQFIVLNFAIDQVIGSALQLRDYFP